MDDVTQTTEVTTEIVDTGAPAVSEPAADESLFLAHLKQARGEGEAQPVEGNQPTTEAAPEEAQPQPEEVPDTRFQSRIDEITREREDERRRREQLELVIASNPVMRAQYEALARGEAPPMAYGEQQAQQPEALPAWDPDDPSIVRQYQEAVFSEMAQPYLQKIDQLEAALSTIAQAAQTQQYTAVVNQVDEAIFSEIPTAKENDEHFQLAQFYFAREIAKLPLQHQKDLPSLLNAAKAAAKATKENLKFTGAQASPQLQQAAPVANHFAETGGNMVQPRPTEPTNAQGMFLAHLQKARERA